LRAVFGLLGNYIRPNCSPEKHKNNPTWDKFGAGLGPDLHWNPAPNWLHTGSIPEFLYAFRD